MTLPALFRTSDFEHAQDTEYKDDKFVTYLDQKALLTTICLISINNVFQQLKIYIRSCTQKGKMYTVETVCTFQTEIPFNDF